MTEKELLADPEFFTVLARAQAGAVSGVDIRLKRGGHHNELTRYRYDVICIPGPGCWMSAMLAGCGGAGTSAGWPDWRTFWRPGRACCG